MGFSISVSPWKKFLATSHFITYKVWYFVTSNGCLKAILDHRSITFHIAISHLFSIYYFLLLQPPSLSSSLIPTAGLASGHHRRGTSAKTERTHYQTFNPDSLFPSPSLAVMVDTYASCKTNCSTALIEKYSEVTLVYEPLLGLLPWRPQGVSFSWAREKNICFQYNWVFDILGYATLYCVNLCNFTNHHLAISNCWTTRHVRGLHVSFQFTTCF